MFHMVISNSFSYVLLIMGCLIKAIDIDNYKYAYLSFQAIFAIEKYPHTVSTFIGVGWDS